MLPLMTRSNLWAQQVGTGQPTAEDLRLRAQQVFDLRNKEVFAPEFPKMMFFRTPETAVAPLLQKGFGYEEWSQEMARLDGIGAKAANEEIWDFDTSAMAAYLNRFAYDNPKQLVFLHFNGMARDPVDAGSKYFAGHWLYLPGGIGQNDLAPLATRIYLPPKALKHFTMERGIKGPNRIKQPDDIVIVQTDVRGRKNWGQSEQVTLRAIGPNYIDVQRGMYETKALNFRAGQFYVAPHYTSGPWGKKTNPRNRLAWAYNFSPTCPRDLSGKNCSDVLLEEFGNWFSSTGKFRWFQGVEFDIAPWVLPRKVDLNFDGRADGGIINGRNNYALGSYNFYKRIKQKLGPFRMVLADCFSHESQRAVDVLDGMENEGFSAPDDPYLSNWASTLNRLEYWERFNKSPNKFNYVVIKDNGVESGKRERGRLAFAATTILGLTCTSTFLNRVGNDDQGKMQLSLPDEVRKGDDKQMQWLGKPVGEIRWLSEGAPNLVGQTYRNATNWTGTSGIVNQAASTKIVFPGKKPRVRVKLRIPDLPGGDILVSMKVRATPIPGFGPTVPRNIDGYLRINEKSVGFGTGKEKLSQGFNTVLAGSTGYADGKLYFRSTPPGKAELVFECDANASIWIQELTVQSAIPAMGRAFENGVVLANPSHQTITIDLNQLFPGRKLTYLTSLESEKPPWSGRSIEGGKISLGGLSGIFLKNQ